MLIDHSDQQIVLQKTWNLESWLGTNVGTYQAKFVNLDFSISRFLYTTWLELAFAKTAKRRKLAVKSVNFQIGSKIQVLKNTTNLQKLQFLPNGTSLPELQTAKNRTQVYVVTSNHLDQ